MTSRHLSGRRLGFRHVILFVTVCFLTALISSNATAREIVDMAGRKVTVLDTITKVYGVSPPATYLIYAMDPGLVAGLNYTFNDEERPFLRPDVAKQPILGGWFGQGQTPNMENILVVKPDIMIVWWWKKAATNEKIEQMAAMLHLPLVYVKLDTLDQYADAFVFLGELFHLEDRGRLLADYTKNTMAEVRPVLENLSDRDKVKVYYAEGIDGLKTECDKSSHAELINLAGGRNIVQCEERNPYGMQSIAVEQVMAADPEVILAKEQVFFERVYGEPSWQRIRAIKNRKIFLIPTAPFNWFDRPPSFMRILGLKWLTNILYPDRYPKDIAAEAREFYKLFLGVDLDEAEIKKVLR